MTTPISGIPPEINQLAQAAAAQPKVVQVDSSASKPTVTEPKKDSVKLSGAAQARSLKHQGQTIAQIALQMGLDAKTVSGYVGSSAIPKQAATVTPQVNKAATAEPRQIYTPVEEATESGAAKAAETVQRKNNGVQRG